MNPETRKIVEDAVFVAVFVAIFATIAVEHHRKTEPVPRAATLEQQKMCADQSKKVFTESYPWATSYIDHFDAKTDVCYLLVDEDYRWGKVAYYSTYVYDAFGGATRASYFTSSDWMEQGKPPILCYVNPPNHPEILCKSKFQFDALIEKYFGLWSD